MVEGKVRYTLNKIYSKKLILKLYVSTFRRIIGHHLERGVRRESCGKPLNEVAKGSGTKVDWLKKKKIMYIMGEK